MRSRVRRAVLVAALGIGGWATAPLFGQGLEAGPGCDDAALPLDVSFGPGWSEAEMHRTGAFLCRMLPVLRDLYGDPFERLRVALVKDPDAAGAWTFSPLALEVRSDGAWDPALLTHELVHAFRGRRVLTRTGDGRPRPELFGFEEGFAEAVAVLAMNEYARRACSAGDCRDALVPQRKPWTSELEWTYDMANDASLRTGALWSDGGGTGKARERYQMAAAVMLRLETRAPGISRRFNEAYYARLRDGEDTSRELVLAILEELCPEMDGHPLREWVARQAVLDGRPPVGMRDWMVDASPLAGIGDTSRRFLHLVETRPDGHDAGVAGATGILSLQRETGTHGERLYPLLMQPLARGFPAEELVLARTPRD